MVDGGTDTERKVADAARQGLALSWPGDELHALAVPTPESMRAWGDERTIRGSFLRDLLVDPSVHPKGVRLCGFRIRDWLDLEYTVTVPLELDCCLVEQPIVMSGATIPRLTLVRSHVAGLVADGLRVACGINVGLSTFSGPVRIRRATIDVTFDAVGTTFVGVDETNVSVDATGTRVNGHVQVSGARFAGALELRGAVVTGHVILRDTGFDGAADHGYAIDGDGIVADGGLFLLGVVAQGALRFHNATLGGLTARRARLDGKDDSGVALAAPGATVHGSVTLTDGFTTTSGSVRVTDITVTGGIEIEHAQIAGDASDGRSFSADRCRVSGGVHLTDSTFGGAVALSGGSIDGQLVLRNSDVCGTDVDGDGVLATSVTVRGDVLLDGTFTCAGAVQLGYARIHGALAVSGTEFGAAIALHAERATFGALYWFPRARVRGRVNLRGARAGLLLDDWRRDHAHWPPQGSLELTGFTYDGFGKDATWQQRLAWLRLQHAPEPARDRGFASQPYRQLVQVFRAAGNDADARRIAIARHDDLREFGNLTRLRRWGSRFLGVTIRYGYQPGRAVVLLLATYLALTGAFTVAQHRPGTVVARSATAFPADAALHCRAGHPCFYPALYALDVVVPILDVADGDAWRPDARADWGWLFVTLTVVGTVVGWGATTLAVVGFTNVVRKE